MEIHLSRDGDGVLLVAKLRLLIETVRRLEERRVDALAVELEAVTNDVQRALAVEVLRQRVEERGLEAVAVLLDELRPDLGLAAFDEVEELELKEAALGVEVGGVALLVPAFGE